LKHRIALIHATPVAIEPIRDAFAAGWPEAELLNILDESLTNDRAKLDTLDHEMYVRFQRLAEYARHIRARGVLFTCSAFGEAIGRAASLVDIPVLRPNEAMFDAALAAGNRIGMVATFAPAVASMEEEFREAAQAAGSGAELRATVAAGAMDALRAGDEATHNRLVAESARGLAGCDAIMLAHFSTARALEAVRKSVRQPVLTAPHAAMERLRSLVLRPEPSR